MGPQNEAASAPNELHLRPARSTRCADRFDANKAYNGCFLALPCDALATGSVPAWLLGSEVAPARAVWTPSMFISRSQ